MSAQIPAEALQLRSLVRADQTLELFLDVAPGYGAGFPGTRWERGVTVWPSIRW